MKLSRLYFTNPHSHA